MSILPSCRCRLPTATLKQHEGSSGCHLFVVSSHYLKISVCRKISERCLLLLDSNQMYLFSFSSCFLWLRGTLGDCWAGRRAGLAACVKLLAQPEDVWNDCSTPRSHLESLYKGWRKTRPSRVQFSVLDSGCKRGVDCCGASIGSADYKGSQGSSLTLRELRDEFDPSIHQAV